MSILRALMPNTAKLFSVKKCKVPPESAIPVSDTESGKDASPRPSLTPRPNDSGDTLTRLTIQDGEFQHFKGPGSCSTQTTLPLPSESGDDLDDHYPNPISHPVHYESFYQPTTYQRCWTIRDFITVTKYPKMLKPYKLAFDDAIPPVEFRINLSRSGTLSLQPVMEKKVVKSWGSTFVKYGFSLGPHHSLGEDFTLYSPILQIKNLNKTHLNIFESRRIIHSYLVDGHLNLIVRFTPFSPKTQPVREGVLGTLNNRNGEAMVESCSQFSFSKVDDSFEKYLTASEIEDEDEDTSSGSTIDDLDVDIKNPECSIPQKSCLQTIPSSEVLKENADHDIEYEESIEYLSSESCLHYTQIKSKPLRRSRKGEFLRQKKQLWTHTASSPLLMYKMPHSRNIKLNQTL